MRSKQASASGLLRSLLPDAIILVLVLAAYLPAYSAGFIWDDDAHLTHNPHIVGSAGFTGIWMTSAATYYPLVLTSFWILHAIWGLNPFAFHLVNVIVHAFCAILLRRVLLKLKAGNWMAWLGALLWVLHPVQVESAAWVTELKNTQSCVFYLVAILLFLRWRSPAAAGGTRSQPVFYLLFLFSFALALLSKTSTVMLPVVLVLCSWWIDGKWSWRALRGVLPLFGLSALAAGWTIWEQQFHSGALGAEWIQSFPERFAVAGRSTWFYLGKLAWPTPLVFLYPRWNIDVHRVLTFLPAAAVIAVLAVLWWFQDRIGRAPFFAFAYFVVSLFPVLDFFNIYFFRYSFVGDHFQYLASMGPLALAGAGIVRATESVSAENSRWILCAASCVLAVVLGVLTNNHAEIFQNDEKLWSHTIADNPDAWLAHNNLAAIYIERGNTSDAIHQLETTLSLQPNYAEGHANLGMALIDSGDFDEAIRHLRQSIELAPTHERAYDYLGEALMSKGQLDEAAEQIQKAVAMNPLDWSAQENLAIALARGGKVRDALPHYAEAARGNPQDLDYRMNYGKALLFASQNDAAAVEFSAVLQMEAGDAQAHKYLGITLMKLQRPSEAMNHLMEAARLDPRDVEVRQKLDVLRAESPK